MQEASSPDPGPTVVESLLPIPPKQFSKRSTVLCFSAAVLGIVLMFGVGGTIEPQGEHVMFWGPLVFGTCGLILLIGCGCGIAALYAGRKEGRKGVFAIATIGTTLNLAAMGFAACVVVGQWTLWQTGRGLHERQRANAAFEQADRAFNARFKNIQLRYRDTGAALTEPPARNIASSKTREELRNGIDVIKNYVAASKSLRDFATNCVALYSDALSAPGIPEERRRTAVRRYREGLAPTLKVVVKLRDADVRRAEIMLGAVEFLDKHWGEWNPDRALKFVRFNDEMIQSQYDKLIDEFEETADEFLKLESEAKSVSER